MKAEQNERLTRIGPGTPCGALLRRYWQPVALAEEFDPALDSRMAERPLKAVRVLGQDMILFRDDLGRWGLLDREAIGDNAAGKQFRSASLGEADGQRWPMTRIMREFHRPDIRFEPRPWGFQLTTLRAMTEALTITQMHVPVDDTRTYWYAFFTSFDKPVDKVAMRAQRAQFIEPPHYLPKAGRHNQWGFDPREQRERTYLGMGEEDINVHDQWAVESMGPIQDRTREHLGTTDKVIMAHRRLLLQAIDTVQAGGEAPGVADATLHDQIAGPDTVDGIAPAGDWVGWWQQQAQDKRRRAPWLSQRRADPMAGHPSDRRAATAA